ncbi:MAG: dTDP-4-dehydrorhamnose 3,5-epimerase family protein [Thermodesulfovibrionales bacterium]|nr:dTDP-4-dehydrorhamnose 3,5-epimerase family protein [Thermodesulfovibrionales bacterium]
MFKTGDIEGVFVKKMETYADNRGWLGELFRKDDPTLTLIHGNFRTQADSPERTKFYPAMSYISITNPDVVRGPHEHREQTDYFCFLGKFKLYLWDNRKDSPTHKNKKIFENADRLIVVVPPGVVHAYKNTGEKDAIVLNFPDRLYGGWNKEEKVDEIRYEDDAESPFKIE